MAESSNRFIALNKSIKMYIQKQQNKKVNLPLGFSEFVKQRTGKEEFSEGKYAISIIDDKEFYHASKCLETQSKGPKKQTESNARETNQTQLKR